MKNRLLSIAFVAITGFSFAQTGKTIWKSTTQKTDATVIANKTNLNNPAALKAHLRRWSLVMEMGLLKEHWDSSRHRLNFLEISRRIGVRVSDAEFAALQQELRLVEQKYQRVLGEWQRF